MDASEGELLHRCLYRAIKAMAPEDLAKCSKRLEAKGRFISILANNYLAIRVPSWTDSGHRLEADITLIWPQNTKPSALTTAEFRRMSTSRFKHIPYFTLDLSWEECLALTHADWRVFRIACHDALTLVRTKRLCA